jgi:hypothetical protein
VSWHYRNEQVLSSSLRKSYIMPLLLAGLLPPPQRAFIKPSTEDIATEATGTQIASNNGRKSPRNRRPRPAHPILPKPPELPEDNIFTHFQKEADRKDGASCVFLLWGSTDSERFPTWAIDVPIADSKSEDEIFTSLAKQYAEELGFWRRYLTFRKFSRLRPVTVCSSHVVACLYMLKSSIVSIDQPFFSEIFSLH